MTPIRVVAAAIIRDDLCLVAYRPGADGGWEFPGGKIDAGETPEQALAREIEEELGSTIRVGPPLATNTFDVADTRIELTVYRATITAGEPAASEHSEIRWVAGNDLEALAWLPGDVPLIGHVRAELKRSEAVV